MEAVAMKIARLLSGYFVDFLLFLGVATLLFGPGLVQASTEKSLNASTTILPDNPLASAVTQEKASRQESFGRLPLYFIANRGQVDRKVQFYTQGPGQRLAFTSREAVLSLSQGKGKVAKIHLTPVGMQPRHHYPGAGPPGGQVQLFFWVSDQLALAHGRAHLRRGALPGGLPGH